jgi:hypothetical protein
MCLRPLRSSRGTAATATQHSNHGGKTRSETAIRRIRNMLGSGN